MSRMIQTNMGEMPLQDYLDIRALECGFDSYKELEEAGFSIEIPEISKEKENNYDCQFDRKRIIIHQESIRVQPIGIPIFMRI